jgi:DNA polymerase
MTELRDQLIDATIEHLQQLKEQGVRFVTVSPENIAALSTIPNRDNPAKFTTRPPAQIRPEPRQPATPATLPGTNSPPQIATKLVTAEGEPKAQAMAALKDRAMRCVKCPHLASSRKNVVFGVGNIDADVMFVGEAPGADEDEQAEPFVGKAGQLLTKIIQAMGLTRDQVYIANILKCRPNTPGQSAGNRKPTPEEMETCIPYLHAQIDLIQPKVLIALGATAVEGLLGRTDGITRLRGNWKTYRNIPLMPTYHPAYLLRNQAMSEKRRVWEDMMQVMEKAGIPISDKQRAFFL